MRWGIVGYGEIAPVFIEALMASKGQCLISIASRSRFDFLRSSKKYGDVKIYSEYQSLFDDPEIDIVYVCTTNQLHRENVLSALRAGKKRFMRKTTRGLSR